ncbi:Argonaute-binding protein 1 [Cyphellophora attinorum]|uniref:Argonaute-binding protein 1 n=1 Tax=Cyphellophora attinorum TaxID=1664694 RepID=A0A0N1H6Q1_9EURO|nr:Argonaute-binding protein 1 [Phialophora attinorum]KPI38453.1 Argonaute-binding protein 1 [Phialophora attinorum]
MAVPNSPVEGGREGTQSSNHQTHPQFNGSEALQPVQPPHSELASHSHEDEEGEDEEERGEEMTVTNQPASKRKKKRSKPKSKRGLNAPTGYEEWFADPPVTPEVHAEEQELYAQDIPFIERILTAIQRFERTRKLTPTRRDIFYKYLAYGGLDVSPNMFQTVDEVQKKEMSKEELAVALSQVSIGTDKYDVGSENALYEVDFLGCAKAFLSRRAIDIWGLDTRDKTVEVTTTLERFMDYLLQHDVCQEYRTEVLETRNFCRQATDELCACAEAGRQLPGDFNIACSTLLEGSYSRNYDGKTYWGPERDDEWNFVGFTPDIASQIMSYAMAGAAPENIWDEYQGQLTDPNDGLSVVQTKEFAGFEITHIIPPSKECLKMYKTDCKDYRPVGVVRAIPWTDPAGPPEDLTPDERAQIEAQQSTAKNTEHEEYVFLIEQNIQHNMRVGMKLQATLHKVSCGIWFFDDFQKVFPHFDTFIANDLMTDYQTPVWLKGSVPYEEERERERLLEAEKAEPEAEPDAKPEQEREHDNGHDDSTNGDAEHL